MEGASTPDADAAGAMAAKEEDSTAVRLRGHGTLTVHLRSASNLIKADFAGLSDPYVQVHVSGQQSMRCKTQRKTLEPVWDEKLDFEGVLESIIADPLRLEVYDQDFGVADMLKKVASSKHVHNSDDKLGRVTGIDLTPLLQQDTLEFNDIALEGVKSGTISFAVTWTADSNVDANSVHAIVERDPEVRSMLRDVRRAMDQHAFKSRTDGGGAGGKCGGKSYRVFSRSRAATDTRRSRDVKFAPAEQPQPRGLRRQDSKMSDGSASSELDRRLSMRKICHLLCGPVLDPNSRFRTMWNVCLAAFIIYCGISVPLEIAFEQDMVDEMCGVRDDRVPRTQCTSFLLWFWLNFIVDLWFITDICVNFRTGYYKEGHFVSDDWLAAKNYLRGSFLMDCLGSFPLNIVMMAVTPENPYGDTMIASNDAGAAGASRANRLLRLLRLAKLAKLARMAKLARYLANFEEFLNPGVLAVMKLTIIGLMCCHWFGCLWWLISDLEMSESTLNSPWEAGNNNWHPPPWLKYTESLGVKYWHSFYWGAGMVTSMVPRDIEPLTALECAVTTFTMFSGLMLNAYIISSLTTALASMNSKKELAGKQLDTIRNYLLLKGVPTDLRSRILEYYEYLFTSSESLASSIKMDQMPPNLSTQLVISMSRKLAAKCAFFRDVNNVCLVRLMTSLTPRVFVPSQLLVFEGHNLREVYFINRGHIQLLQRTSHVALLRDNDNFGINEFIEASLLRKPAVVKHTAKAVTYCDVMLLSTEKLQEALEQDEAFQVRLRTRTCGSPISAKVKRNFLNKRISRYIADEPDKSAQADEPDKSAQAEGEASTNSSNTARNSAPERDRRQSESFKLQQLAEEGDARAAALLMA